MEKICVSEQIEHTGVHDNTMKGKFVAQVTHKILWILILTYFAQYGGAQANYEYGDLWLENEPHYSDVNTSSMQPFG